MDADNTKAVTRTIPPAPPSEVDPLLAPPTSMPQTPLLIEEHAPILPEKERRTLLHFSPVTRHMENLDALRIVCMLVIITTHVTGPFLKFADLRGDHGPLFLIILAVNVGCRFGVPCFMMISFFIYWHQLYEKGRSWGELLQRRFKRLAPAFICWSCFYFVIHKLLQKRFGHEFDSGMSDLNWHHWRVLYDVFILGRAEYHLYYLPLVMECLLLIPLLRLLWRRPMVSWAWTIFTAAWWCVVLYGHIWSAPGSRLYEFSGRIREWTHEETALPCLVFPLIGMMCAGQKAWRNMIVRTPDWAWAAGTVLGIALHAAESIYLLPHGLAEAMLYLKVGRLLTAICLFALVVRHPLMRDPFPRVSRHAFGLHFMHPAIILLLGFLEWRFFGPTLYEWRAYVVPLLAIHLLLTFTITFGLCLLVSRVKRLEFLVV